MRYAFWKWGEDGGRKKAPTALLCGSSFVFLTKCYVMGAPPWNDRGSQRAYLQHFISSFYESIVNKREKLEFGWEQGWIAAAGGLLPLRIKPACLRLGLDMTGASLCHSKGRFYLSLRNWSNWRAEYLTQYFEFSCSLSTNIVCCWFNWFAGQLLPCYLWWARSYGQRKLVCCLSPVILDVW